MNLLVGKDKFPMIEVRRNIYLHILPITKFQFERYLWSNKQTFLDYNKLLSASPRISFKELRLKNLKDLFITHITFEEALEYAKWMEGEIPQINILFEFDKKFNDLKFSEIRNCLKSFNNIDVRFWKTLDALEGLGIFTIKKLFNELNIVELCYVDELENKIQVKEYGSKTTYEVVGESPYKVRWKKHSFRIIQKKEEN